MGLGPGSGSIFQPQFNVICAQAATKVISVPCTPAEQELDCGHQLIPRELGKGRCGEAAATHPEKLEPLCPAQRRKDWGEFPATQPSEKRNNHLPQQPAPVCFFFFPHHVLPAAKLRGSSARMWRANLNESLSKIRVCIPGQIYPDNSTSRANPANKFPQRQTLKEQIKGKGEKKNPSCAVIFSFPG